MTNKKVIDTFSEYINDETRVSPAERERLQFEISLIGKMIEARKWKFIVLHILLFMVYTSVWELG